MPDATSTPAPAVVAPVPAKPDAVLMSLGAYQALRTSNRLEWVKRKYGPILGSERVHVHEDIGYRRFCPEGGIHRNYPPAHPSAGQDRYTWVPQPDGTSYGYLQKDESLADDAALGI